MKTALLIIDVQNDYFEGGKCELVNPMKALANVEYALNYFREAVHDSFIAALNNRFAKVIETAAIDFNTVL